MPPAFANSTSHLGPCVSDPDRAIAEVDPPVKRTSFFIQKRGLRVERMRLAKGQAR
jgi:hypothetical protein